MKSDFDYGLFCGYSVVMKQIKAVVFDMDGVLLNTEIICNRTWVMAAEKLGLPQIDVLSKRCIGRSRRDTIALLADTWKSEEKANRFMETTSYYFGLIENNEGIEKMPYVVECLDYLKSKGYVLSVASSTREIPVHRQLTNAGLIDYFSTITCGDQVTKSKPDPEIYLKACQSIGFAPEECAAIEDSPNGIKSAYGAGLNAIMVPDQIPCNDEVRPMLYKLCSSLSEVMEVL